MNIHNLIFAFVVSRCCLVLAQQPCYWIDGSDAPETVNCYSSQESVCCWPGEVCLSNGLCFGATEDRVRLTHFSPCHDLSSPSDPSRLLIETEKTYRGACTSKIWSNTTVCPTQFCPEGKVSLFKRLLLKAILIEPSSLGQIQTLLINMTIVNKQYAIDLWKCPRMTKTTNASEPYEWWCGNDEETPPCQTGPDSSFVTYTDATALLIAPTTSSPSSAIDASTKPISLSSSSTDVTSIDTATPRQNPHESIGQSTAKDAAPTSHAPRTVATSAQGQPPSNKLPTAIGVGIGVPLGIATIGFLGFLFTRETKLKDKRKSTNSSHASGSRVNVDASPRELRDTGRPYELEDSGRKEMPGTEARIIPVL